ncbi:MAG: NHL repeat-containing protein, partial [Planctomycetota bacterium]
PARSELWLGTGGNAACDGCILRLDIFTGEAQILADNTSVNSGAHPGLAIDANGNLFGTEGDTSTLLRIDSGASDTGKAFTVGPFNASNNGNGMTFVGPVLYVASDDDLLTVDPATGAGTLVGEFSFGGFTTSELSGLERYSIVSMTTDASGTIFAILQQGGGGGGGRRGEPTYLVTIDPDGPVINKVGQIFLGPIVDPTPLPLDGLAFVPTAFIIEALP